MNRFKLKSLLAAVLSVAALPVLAAPSLHYTVTELGMFTPTAINNLGQVSGFANTGFEQVAVLYSGGALNPLGQLAGSSEAYGINDAGKVVGVHGDDPRAFSYAANQVSEFAPAGSTARAVNNAGQIAGAIASGDDTHAYVYANNKLTDINDGGAGSGSMAAAISDNGTVVGTRWDDKFGERHAFIHANGNTVDLSGAVGGFSNATGVNDQGQVILTAQADQQSAFKSYFYANGVATDLGSLDGGNVFANGINNAGAVVGTADFFNWPNLTGGFIWRDGVMVNLNALIDPALGWTITGAFDINENNQIAVTGCSAFGDCQALLLSVSAVPEPETYALLIGGLGLVGWSARRRKAAA
nr:PEP-CTERM sorting domain-containing protein [uncultured Duganella sp.]